MRICAHALEMRGAAIRQCESIGAERHPRIPRSCFITRIVVVDEESGERQGDKKRGGSLFFGTRSSRLTKYTTTRRSYETASK